jgi:peptidoglycan/xylan/chitin deacetylase (PgdA/CDA1 family)
MEKIKTGYKKIIIVAVLAGFLLLALCLVNRFVFLKPQKKQEQDFNAYLVEANLGSEPVVKSETATSSKPLTLKGFSEVTPILMYHYVEVPSATTTLKGLYLDPVIFDEQLKVLKDNNYETLFVSELANNLRQEKKAGAKNIVLTFDDGYEDFYTQVWPVLKKYNYKATLYVIINKLGAKGYLSREQVKELAFSGLVEIGSHTFNHPDLRSLKKKDANFEIQASKVILEQISGKPVLSFAYPYGYYKTDFFSVASGSNYLAAVSVIPGVRQGGDNIWLLRRLRPGARTGEIFKKWLSDWEQANY